MTRPSPLRLHAATVHLPPGDESLADAAAGGRVPGRRPEDADDVRLPVAVVEPVQLAANAVTTTLQRTQLHPDAVDDLYYAWTYFQGGHFWSPAHALADASGLTCANPIGIQQMCNGAAACLHLAQRAAAAGAGFRAVIATGDAFTAPGFDRWSGDYGVLYGDAGTAVVAVSSDVPAALAGPSSTLLGLRTIALPAFAAMHRNPAASPTDPTRGWPVDVQAAKRHYLARHGQHALAESLQAAVRQALPAVLADVARLDRVLDGRAYLPRLTDVTLDALYVPALRKLVDVPLVRSGRRTGHLGAGDLIANLADAQLDDTPGAHVDGTRVDLLVSAGAGFTISVAAVATTPGSSA